MPPVFPGAAAERLSWPGATGLAEDVRRYGKWMRDEAEKRIGHLYPKVKISGVDATVIAWIWARTVTCPTLPAPAQCRCPIVLARQEKGKERYVVPIPDGKRVRFEIGGPDGVPRDGTVCRTGAVCLLCDTPVPLSYIRAEGKAGRMGAQLMAIAAEGTRQRYYLAPTRSMRRQRMSLALTTYRSRASRASPGFPRPRLRHAHMGRPLHQPPANRSYHLQ